MELKHNSEQVGHERHHTSNCTNMELKPQKRCLRCCACIASNCTNMELKLGRARSLGDHKRSSNCTNMELKLFPSPFCPQGFLPF